MKRKIEIKRLTFVFVVICITMSIYGIMIHIPKNKVIQTNATPITNKVIVIDAGHGLPDEGAEGFNGTTEQAINLQISLKLQKLIEQSGAKVVLTRSDENGIYATDSAGIKNKKVSDTKNRVEIGNSNDANLFVSIHLNKFPASSQYHGWQTFFQKNNESSKRLAVLIQESLNKNIQMENHRQSLPINGIYIMDKLQVPAVIVECGFLSNPEETENLRTEIYQNKLVWGIYLGIQEYFTNEGNNR